MITSQIVGQSGQKLKLNEHGIIGMVEHDHPPTEEGVFVIPFRQYMTDDGTPSGDNDMRVNASSVSPELFYIAARQNVDVYIKSISIEISDANAELSEFGNLAALTNGIEFFWESQDKGEIIIADSLNTNYDFVRLSGGNPSFGTGASAFRAQNAIANSETYLPFIDFREVFGLRWGIRLRKDSIDKLAFRIKDNISNIDSFNVIAYGIIV